MKRILFALLLVFSGVLLTACGTKLTSVTKFADDGSGMRTVTVEVTGALQGKTSGTELAAVDNVISDACPESMNFSRTEADNGGIFYNFLFSFDSIEDYNAKVAEYSGSVHDAVWFSDASVFKSDIAFSETECSYDIIKWAVTALTDAGYSLASYPWLSGMHELTSSKFYLNKDLEYSGTGQPSFTVPIAPTLEQVRMYSTYLSNRDPAKVLELDFNENGFDRLDYKLAKTQLAQYADSVFIDRGNATVKISLKTEKEIRDFLKKADPALQDADLSYQNQQTLFQSRFEASEKYNLQTFLNQFRLETEYVLDYIALPDDIPYEEVQHLSTKKDTPAEEGWNYQGAYKIGSEYVFHALSEEAAELLRGTITYRLSGDLAGTRTVELVIARNGLSISKLQLKNIFLQMGYDSSVSENAQDDTISALIDTKIAKKAGDGQLPVTEDTGFDIRKDTWYFETNADFAPFVPEDGGAKVSTDQFKGSIAIRAEQDSGLSQVDLTGGLQKTYSGSQLAGMVSDGEYAVDETLGSAPIDVKLTFVQKDTAYVFWIIIASILGAAFLLVVAWFVIRLVNGGPTGKDDNTD